MRYFLLSLIFLTACTTQQVCFENSCFEVEIADSYSEQTKGLMFQKSLDEDKGMLFVYEKDDQRQFWMKDTVIPLDIIFIDSTNKVTQIHQANPCQGECEIYTGYGKYVLELNQGTTDSIGLEIGDILII